MRMRLIPIPIDYRRNQSAQGAKEKLRMQAGTEESPQGFIWCLVRIRVTRSKQKDQATATRCWWLFLVMWICKLFGLIHGSCTGELVHPT